MCVTYLTRVITWWWNNGQPGVKPVTSQSEVQCTNHYTTMKSVVTGHLSLLTVERMNNWKCHMNSWRWFLHSLRRHFLHFNQLYVTFTHTQAAISCLQFSVYVTLFLPVWNSAMFWLLSTDWLIAELWIHVSYVHKLFALSVCTAWMWNSTTLCCDEVRSGR